MAPQPPTFTIPRALPASGAFLPSPPTPFLTILEITVSIAAICIILAVMVWFIPQHNREMWEGIRMKRWGKESAGVSQSAFRDAVALEEDADLWVLADGEDEERNLWERDEESAIGGGHEGNGDKYGREEV